MNDIPDTHYWHHARLPQQGQVVMVRLLDPAADHLNTVRVRLPEYGMQMGSLTFTEDQRVQILAGRVIPALVTLVGFHRVPRYLLGRRMPRFSRQILPRRQIPLVKRICLALSPLSRQQILDCDREHTEQLHINSVLRHLAAALQSQGRQFASLEEVYQETRWPQYRDLSSFGRPYWRSLPTPLRNLLIQSWEQVNLSSWRIRDNSLFSPPLRHVGFYCFAIALIWQLEAFLKFHGLLPRDQFLSIQDFIDNIPAGLVLPNLGIEHLDFAFPTLRHRGVLLAHHGPELTFVRAEHAAPRNGLPVFSTDRLGIALGFRTYTVGHELEDQLRDEVQVFGAVSASIYWYKSYTQQALVPMAVLKPTPEDLEEHDNAVHTVLVKGSGRDLNGRTYWEVQDSYGDAGNGDRGHLRLYRGVNPLLILDYVTMRMRRR